MPALRWGSFGAFDGTKQQVTTTSVCQEQHLPVLWSAMFEKDDYFGVWSKQVDRRAERRWLVRATTPWADAHLRLRLLWQAAERQPWSSQLFGFLPSLLGQLDLVTDEMLVLDVADMDRTRPPGQMANQLIAQSERYRAARERGFGRTTTLAGVHPLLTGDVRTDVARIGRWQRNQDDEAGDPAQAVLAWAVGQSWGQGLAWSLPTAQVGKGLTPEVEVQKFCIYLSDQLLTRGQPRPSGRQLLARALASRDPVFVEERIELLLNWGQLEPEECWPDRDRVGKALRALLLACGERTDGALV